MRIEVVDPNGHGLGLAIGLLELGHDVAYRAPRDTSCAANEGARYRDELIEHMFGSEEPAEQSHDALVILDTFADKLHALELGYQWIGGDVGEYPDQLQDRCRMAMAADRVAVIDMSDRSDAREVAFEGMAHVVRLAREAEVGADSPWQPFPFLHNVAVLWLEHLVPADQWLLADDQPPMWDWVFCGTIDHERYRQRRRLALHLIEKRYGQLRGALLCDRPFREAIAVMQRSRLTLDLPGVGELCFRLHESLALGTPVWQPLPTKATLPEGLADVVVGNPDTGRLPDREAVRSIYREHYGPRAAARWLLDRLVADQNPISQATSIVSAAST